MHLHLLFQAALEASWQASLVIVLILLLRPLLGLRVPARWRALLWTLVLLRLLVPAFLLPPSPASLQNIAAVNRPIEQASLAFTRTTGADPTVPPRVRSQGPEESEPLSTPLPPTKSEARAPRPWWHFAALVWAVGSVATGLWIIVGTVRLYRRLRRDAGEVDEAIRRVWEHCCGRVLSGTPGEDARARTPRREGWAAQLRSFASLRLGERTLRAPRLVQTSAVSSPALLGVFRPVLLIPRHGGESLSVEDWEHIFLHELAHFRRRDHWLQALQLLALCVHWFNPLVWLGFRYLRADRELAADEWALRHLHADRQPAAYGDTLLKILTAQARGPLTPGLVGIMEDGAQMRQRLRSIVAFAPHRLTGSIAGVALVLALGAVVLGRQTADLKDYAGLAPTDILVTAARNGDRPVLEQMFADRVDVNAVATVKGERTALAAAVAASQLETVRLLVAHGADVEFAPEKADAPLVIALKKGWQEGADFLREKGATAEPELLAAATGDSAAIDTFLATETPDFTKLKTLCEIAAANGHATLFAKLYDAVQALPDHQYWDIGNGALVSAVARGHRTVIEEMIRRDPNLVKGGVNRLGAAAAKSAGMPEWLRTKGFKVPDYTDGERLIDATESENLSEMRRLIAAGADVNYRGESGWTPLTKAAAWGCPRAVKLLLENYADANSIKSPGWNYSALCLAKTPEIADLLFAAGANVNAKLYGRDVHIVSYCVDHGPTAMVQWFLDHGVEPAKVKGDASDPTLLFNAATPEITEMLIARGVDVNATDENGRTALFHLAQFGKTPSKVITVLLEHGANPNARDRNGSTPLMCAMDGATVDALVAAGAEVSAKDQQGTSVMAAYLPTAKQSRLEALLRHHGKLDAANGAALLFNASFTRNLAEVKALLAKGVDPKIGYVMDGKPMGTALSAAIVYAAFDVAAVLRAAGAKDVGLLSEAAAKGDLAGMKALLAAGADVNERSATDMTPLHFAVLQGQSAAVQLLLDHGADVNLFDGSGTTAHSTARSLLSQVEFQHHSQIHRLDLPAAKRALDEIVASLSARKLDANARDAAGETALMRAAKLGGLLSWVSREEGGVDVNAQRPDGMTALMLAIVTQPKNAPTDGVGSVTTRDAKGKMTPGVSARAHVVKTLLSQGADLTLRNAAGKTALDLARENGNAEILGLLGDVKP